MKACLYILATIFIFGILTIGGCFYLGKTVYDDVKEALSLPEHITPSNIKKHYGETISVVKSKLLAEESIKFLEIKENVSDDLVAIFLREKSKKQNNYMDKEADVYGKNSVKKTSNMLMNGIGRYGLQIDGETDYYIAYELQIYGKTYILCFVDWKSKITEKKSTK